MRAGVDLESRRPEPIWLASNRVYGSDTPNTWNDVAAVDSRPRASPCAVGDAVDGAASAAVGAATRAAVGDARCPNTPGARRAGPCPSAALSGRAGLLGRLHAHLSRRRAAHSGIRAWDGGHQETEQDAVGVHGAGAEGVRVRR